MFGSIVLSHLSLDAETVGVIESEIVDLASYHNTAEEPSHSIPLESWASLIFKCYSFGRGAFDEFGSIIKGDWSCIPTS